MKTPRWKAPALKASSQLGPPTGPMSELEVVLDSAGSEPLEAPHESVPEDLEV